MAGGVQRVFRGFSLKNDAMRAVRVNQNSEVVERTAKQGAETHYKAL